MLARIVVAVTLVIGAGVALATATGGSVESATSLPALLAPSAFALMAGLALLAWARRRAAKRAQAGHAQALRERNATRICRAPAGDTVAAPPRPAEIQVSETVPEIEQAKVLLKFGHIEDAAASLAAVSGNPVERVEALLRARGRASASDAQAAVAAFADAARVFNVDLRHDSPASASHASLENFPHVMQEIVNRWGQRSCGVYLDCLLLDSRNGNRAGFPAPVAAEIILLRRLADQRVQRQPAESLLRVVHATGQMAA